jgi:hypothetical protein
METMSPDKRRHVYTPATDLAYGRIDALLRAYGINHSAARGQYCLRFLAEAEEQVESNEDGLESCAARIAMGRINQGVDAIIVAAGLSLENTNRENFHLALQASSIPQRHPEVILDSVPPDEAICKSIRSYYEAQDRPTLRRISMGASTLRFDAIDEVTQSTERFFQRHPLLRRLLKIILISLTIYLVYSFAK